MTRAIETQPELSVLDVSFPDAGLGAEDYIEMTDAQTLLRKVQRVLFRLDAERRATRVASPNDAS